MQWSQRHFDELNWFLGGEKKDEWRLIRLGYRAPLKGGAAVRRRVFVRTLWYGAVLHQGRGVYAELGGRVYHP